MEAMDVFFAFLSWMFGSMAAIVKVTDFVSSGAALDIKLRKELDNLFDDMEAKGLSALYKKLNEGVFSRLFPLFYVSVIVSAISAVVAIAGNMNRRLELPQSSLLVAIFLGGVFGSVIIYLSILTIKMRFISPKKPWWVLLVLLILCSIFLPAFITVVDVTIKDADEAAPFLSTLVSSLYYSLVYPVRMFRATLTHWWLFCLTLPPLIVSTSCLWILAIWIVLRKQKESINDGILNLLLKVSGGSTSVLSWLSGLLTTSAGILAGIAFLLA